MKDSWGCSPDTGAKGLKDGNGQRKDFEVWAQRVRTNIDNGSSWIGDQKNGIKSI